jgi:hypothetical protein
MGNLIKSLFGTIKKNKKMESSKKTIKEYQDQYSNFDFQWMKGENMSVIEKYQGVSSNGEMIFIDFQSGRKMNIDLLDEFMLTLPAAVHSSPPVNQQIQNQEKESAVTSIVYEDQENIRIDSPIYKLLKKQKKNMVEVSIKIKLNLPPKELYSVLLGSFDDAEKEIIDFVLDGVDMNNIKKSLADSVKKSYYSDPQKPSKIKAEPEKEKTELED